VGHFRIGIYHCPSDGAGWRGSGTNYGGNFGSGAQAFGYNGIIRPLFGVWGVDPVPDVVYTVGPASVTDGLSNTAAVAEMLIGTEAFDPERVVWQTPLLLALPTELDAFAAECDLLTVSPTMPAVRGVTWLWKDQWVTGYNHVLPPNHKSCTNFHSVPIGAYTASSSHRGGVNVLRADGHGGFVSADVDRAIWRALGSRDNGEAFDGQE
jgi:prepilin-type processing-associated H-X9-DG protein